MILPDYCASIFSEFYEKMASQTEGAARYVFLILAKWEKGHERFFREYRDKLSDVYTKMPWEIVETGGKSGSE